MYEGSTYQDLRDRGRLRQDSLASMLYGSCARGDAEPGSDIDVLQLVSDYPGSEVDGSLSVVSYLPSQIQEMVEIRSLFAWHLRLEGIYLHDNDNVLHELLDRHLGPDPELTLARVRALTPVVDVSELEFASTSPGVHRVTRYLLRTAVYAKSITLAVETFSIARAALVVDPSGALGRLFEHSTSTPVDFGWELFVNMRDALGTLVGGLHENPYGSLEALVVRASQIDPSLSAIALHALSNESDELGYATNGMPVL